MRDSERVYRGNQPIITSRVLLCSLLVLVCCLFAPADTLVVSGNTRVLPSPLIVDGDEVLAPVTSSLWLLGAQGYVNGATATITTPSGASLSLTSGSKTMRADGQKVDIPAAPRDVQGELYLPAKTIGRWLGAEARFDTTSRTLTMQPLLTIAYESCAEGVSVHVRGTAPLQYTSARLSNPPRVIYDFKHVSLGFAEQQVPVDEGFVKRLRLSQYNINPDIVRVVIDLHDDAEDRYAATPAVGEQGRLVSITIGEKPAETAPAPVVKPTMPVKLMGAFVTPCSATQSELTIISDGPVVVDGDFNTGARELVLRFANGLNTLPPEHLRVTNDKIVKHMAISGSATDPGATLTVTFQKDSGYLIRREGMGIKVLMGEFDIKDMVIVLDAGHGGSDPGACSSTGTQEKDINLDVILRTEKLLKATGAKVVLTRSGDVYPSLDDRPALANRIGSDIFISVHCNSAVSSSLNGTQTYFTTAQSASLASAMHVELVKSLERKNGGVRTAGFLVTRKSKMPAVLLELAFMSNKDEDKLLRTPEFRQKAAEGIVNGIRRYAATTSWKHRRGDAPVTIADGKIAAP